MPQQQPNFDRLTAWIVSLPLRSRFQTAMTAMERREIVVVRVQAGAHTGWGEAAPVPGHTPESLTDIWDQIQTDAQPTGLAGAALAQAAADLEAKRFGSPLWQHLGGSQSVWASAAIGLSPVGSPDVPLLEAVAAAGYRYVKLKINADTDPSLLAAIRDDFPALTIGLDANGSLGTDATATTRAIDTVGFAYLEQPGSTEDLAGHRMLRNVLTTPVVLDESASSAAAVAEILAEDAADAINLKSGRFGTAATLQLASKVAGAGVRVRLGGLIESGIGRAHSVALATLPVFSVGGDIAASNLYFEHDLVTPSWRLNDGKLQPPEAPGIGVEVDTDAIERFALDRFSTQ